MPPADPIFSEQLRTACVKAVARTDRPDLIVRLEVSVVGACPQDHREAVLLAAAEMAVNAVEHGLYQRTGGNIRVVLTCRGGETRLEVSDDGWGTCTEFPEGHGLRTLRALGWISLDNRIEQGKTTGAIASLLVGGDRGEGWEKSGECLY